MERDQSESVKGEDVECEEVISVHVESSQSLQPSTSQELVKPVLEPVEPTPVEMMTSSVGEGGGEEREIEIGDDVRGDVVTEPDKNSLDQIQKPIEQVCFF